MSTDVPTPDRIPMSQRERDVLEIMHGVLRPQPERCPNRWGLGIAILEVIGIVTRPHERRAVGLLTRGLPGVTPRRLPAGTSPAP